MWDTTTPDPLNNDNDNEPGRHRHAVVVNEFVAYVNFVDIRDQLSIHTQVVLTFALCGFANWAGLFVSLQAP